MKPRHAYLIMAHHKFDILKELLMDLDDERNDIFLHIDAKTASFPREALWAAVKKANLVFTARMDIRWGGYSQIACILMLLKTAVQSGYHSYYHFMVGVEFPLQSQEVIHQFFDANQGYEFIGFDSYDNRYMERVRYYHPFNSCARNSNIFQKGLNKIRIFSVAVQRLLKVDLTAKYPIIFKKGNASWSITHNLANYIIFHKEEIQYIYRHSFCADEVFIHTLVYNSSFWNQVYDKEDEYRSGMRISNWDNPQNCYHLSDLEQLMTCGRFFARKIDGEDAVKLIAAIKEKRTTKAI